MGPGETRYHKFFNCAHPTGKSAYVIGTLFTRTGMDSIMRRQRQKYNQVGKFIDFMEEWHRFNAQYDDTNEI